MSVDSAQHHEPGMKEVKQIERPEVKSADITRALPAIGGTKIIVQRHERYQRKVENGAEGSLGSLTPESAKKAYEQTVNILEDMFASVPEEELKDVSFLIVGSNTKFQEKGMRSMETAAQVLQAVKDELSKKI